MSKASQKNNLLKKKIAKKNSANSRKTSPTSSSDLIRGSKNSDNNSRNNSADSRKTGVIASAAKQSTNHASVGLPTKSANDEGENISQTSHREPSSSRAGISVVQPEKNSRQLADFSLRETHAREDEGSQAAGNSRRNSRKLPHDALAEDLVASDDKGNPLKNSRDNHEHYNHHNSRNHFDDRPAISEMVREATAGGVIFRENAKKELEILLVADHFDRWTIPKGHIEEGETAQETAIREIGEEAGVHNLEPICWLGKIHFRYRRANTLVLMSTQIYLFRALGDTDDIAKEDWMNGIRWFAFDEAVDIIAYEDIAKLMLLGRSRLRQRGEIE